MAYLNVLASAPIDRVIAYRRDRSLSLKASRKIHVSHLLGYWIPIQPLRGLLGQAIDGGEPLAAELWHPLRVPMLHSTESVRSLMSALTVAWQRFVDSDAVIQDDDFFKPQIEKLIDLFNHSAKVGESIVSILEQPADVERSSRVELPMLD